ncbi:MAG: phosphotransferase family protein, partial [Geodermatophilaceae bacterium]
EHGLPTLGWAREYGRFRPGRSPWAVLAYAHPAGLAVRVDVYSPRAERFTTRLRPSGGRAADRFGRFAGPHDGQSGSELLIEVSPAAADPALPGLGPVLAELTEGHIVRYRPGKRCTLRGQTRSGPRFVKVAPGGAAAMADAALLWGVRSALPFAVAEPHGWDGQTNTAWHGVVPGRPIAHDVLGCNGAAVAVRLAAALAALARAAIAPSRTEGPCEQLARSRRAAGRAAAAVPDLRKPLRAILADLERAHAGLRSRPLMPVHGAPHMHQWLDHGNKDGSRRLGLIDFDRLALGEPELDLATFLAELDAEPSRQVSMIDIEAAAVAGFEGNGVRLDPARLALYRAHKRLAKVARAACSLRPDGGDRALRHLGSVEAALARS